MSSIANLELVFAVGLQKYGQDELIRMIHSTLSGILYDGLAWDDGFLDLVTETINKRRFQPKKGLITLKSRAVVVKLQSPPGKQHTKKGTVVV